MQDALKKLSSVTIRIGIDSAYRGYQSSISQREQRGKGRKGKERKSLNALAVRGEGGVSQAAECSGIDKAGAPKEEGVGEFYGGKGEGEVS